MFAAWYVLQDATQCCINHSGIGENYFRLVRMVTMMASTSMPPARESPRNQHHISRAVRPWLRYAVLFSCACCFVVGLATWLSAVERPKDTLSLSFESTTSDDDNDDTSDSVNDDQDELDWRETRERKALLANMQANLPDYVSRDMDFTVDPCDNFYEHVCGTWVKNATIPGHLASFDRCLPLPLPQTLPTRASSASPRPP